MKNLILYKNFNGNGVRIIFINNEPYFCAADIGKILDLSSIHRQVRSFRGGRHTVTTPTESGDQPIVYVNEANLYRLIFKSKKENAKKFQDWIFEDVIPSIRKTGKYQIKNELKEKSTKARNLLTDSWKECGIKAPKEYAMLTIEEYKVLFDKRELRKQDMTEDEIKILLAFECLEMLNLNYNPTKGFFECKKSIMKTAKVIENVKSNIT